LFIKKGAIIIELKWIKNFGKKLKNERRSWGMSRGRLARLSYLDRETIEEIENGKNLNPDFYDMLNICTALDSSVYFYLEKDGREKNGKRKKQ